MQNYKLTDDSSRLFLYQRRETIAVKVGNIEIGGDNPIRVQSMANTDTNDIDSSIQQALRIEKAGGELIRFTAQGIKEATNLKQIRENFRKSGGVAPLVADIHFNPQAAFVAAEAVEKVRINPGNFVDRVHTLQRFDYTDDEYQQEIEKIKDKLYPLLDICKANHTAIRIGVNHGSLSDRILSRYGDTPRGMVESCMEFLRLCMAYDFYNIVISIKASNTVIMVQTVRLLVDTMNKAGMKFPLHLGVTEAGDGEDGRVKSALGIGALLQDGIGDTIRVSLSEAPENEIPVARKLVDYITTTAPIRSCDTVVAKNSGLVDPFTFKRRSSFSVDKIGDGQVPVVVSNTNVTVDGLSPDYCATDFQSSIKTVFATISTYDAIKNELDEHTVVVLDSVGYPSSQDGIGGQREFIHRMLSDGLKNPVILRRRYMDSNIEDLQIKAGADYGQFFIDGLVDGIWIEAPQVKEESVVSLMFTILQGSRARVSKTEYVSCPSCGRTLFDLQTTLAKIKERTSHLKGLKIGVMGCIVNGPGEMADADYGYVGSARGKVNLYKGQTCLEKAIPQEEAVDRLIQLIKENGDWKDN
ncbi:MAG: (E)-4-hydroxy-3-methylbut-2-enyl-diphosphate synthase [Paludibacteraceae bacterium]|nr:(E)-4-hydroxy-3-methylbut-2-enyl-diphosphate synthase [Paludibacteraceae bacterium]